MHGFVYYAHYINLCMLLGCLINDLIFWSQFTILKAINRKGRQRVKETEKTLWVYSRKQKMTIYVGSKCYQMLSGKQTGESEKTLLGWNDNKKNRIRRGRRWRFSLQINISKSQLRGKQEAESEIHIKAVWEKTPLAKTLGLYFEISTVNYET